MLARMPRLLATVVIAALLGACTASAWPDGPPATTPAVSPAADATAGPNPRGEPAEDDARQRASLLPRGGSQVFPAYRLVGYAGAPGSAALGRLGVGRLEDRVAELDPLAARYASGRQPLPVLELIATVVRSTPGADGRYRTRLGDDVIERHLAAARATQGYLLLNIQPGRADLLQEVQAYERWLREPDVGVALDPEWAVGPGQVPGRVFGQVTGAQLDGVAAYLSGLVASHELPEKVMLYHQLAPHIVQSPEALGAHPGIALVVSVDGIGSMAQKVATWNRITALTPPYVHRGFKLFHEEDSAKGALMTPEQVLGLTPQPEYVLYE